jgi:hypothetical protein
MNITDKISKEEFLKVYNSYPPNGWTKFAFKYFSQSTLPKDKFLKNIAVYLMAGSFVMGMLGTILNMSREFILGSILPLMIVLPSIAIIMSGGAIMNNLRIRKIRKKLGITKLEYEILAQAYLY